MTVEQFLRCRRQRPWWLTIIVVAVLGAAILADRQGWLLHAGDDMQRYHRQTFTVARVVDGDTLVLDVSDGDRRTTRVRLWGIDAPELARADLGQPAQPWAEASKARADELVGGGTVRLELEPGRIRDRYDRILAYVWIADDLMLNEQLLVDGLAHADDRWRHPRLDRFALLEEQARKARRGLWANPPAQAAGTGE